MFTIFVVTILSSFKYGSDTLSPSRIYLCVYSGLLSVNFLGLSKLQSPWSITSILFFYGASFMFLVPGLWFWLLTKIKYNTWNLNFNQLRETLKNDAKKIDWFWFERTFYITVLLFLVSFSISFFITGGFPILMKNPDDARIKFFTATLLTSYGMFFGPISIMLGLELVWFSFFKKKRRIGIILTMALVLLLYLTVVTRYDLFRVLIFAVILFHYGLNKLRFRHIFWGLIIGLSLFFIGFIVRVKTDSIGAFNEAIKVKMPHGLAWTSNIYAYLANDFWNYDFAIKKYVDGDHSYPFQYGVGLFRALLWNLRLEPGLLQAYRFDSLYNESATKLKGLNTVIYVWHLYKDFGIFGVYGLPFLAGIIIWKFYLNLLLHPSLYLLSLWGIFSGMIALSYHTPLWELWFLYLNIIVVMVAHRKLTLA